MDLVNRAELPCPQDLASLLELGHAPLLGADLHDSPVIVLCSNHGLAFAEVMRQRLFHEDVLAGFACVHGHRNVPMIRRPDDHRVDIATGQQPLVVLGSGGLRVGEGLGLVEGVIPDVTYRGDLRTGHARKRPHQTATAASGSDATDIDRVARRVCHCARRASGSCGG